MEGGEGDYVYSVEDGFLDSDLAIRPISVEPMAEANGVGIRCNLIYIEG